VRDDAARRIHAHASNARGHSAARVSPTQLPAIDVWMKKRLTDYFKAKGTETTIKYIEPSYMVRARACGGGEARPTDETDRRARPATPPRRRARARSGVARRSDGARRRRRAHTRTFPDNNKKHSAANRRPSGGWRRQT
jgi:hypothetical protein